MRIDEEVAANHCEYSKTDDGEERYMCSLEPFEKCRYYVERKVHRINRKKVGEWVYYCKHWRAMACTNKLAKRETKRIAKERKGHDGRQNTVLL